jgi:hypothetical protein
MYQGRDICGEDKKQKTQGRKAVMMGVIIVTILVLMGMFYRWLKNRK